MNFEDVELEGSDDSGDEDFNPTGCGNLSVSEEESGDEVSEGEAAGEEESRKRKKLPNRGPRKKVRRGKVKESEEEEKENSEASDVLTEEERKKKSDSLWKDFLQDCPPPVKKNLPIKPDRTSDSPAVGKTLELPEAKQSPEPKKISQVLTFAGEEIKVEKPVSGGMKKGGIGSLLSRIGKSGKLSTLEKSKLDWESFKQKEGIKEDLETYNKGKSGYLERQDFLSRTDVRQFEREKEMRTQNRSHKR